MKSLFFVLAAVLVSSSAFASSFSVRQTESARSAEVTIRFSTLQTYSSMCFFNSKVVGIIPALGTQLGEIEIVAEQNLGGVCMMALGPHSGSVAVNRKMLPAGKYNVIINKESQGLLEVQ